MQKTHIFHNLKKAQRLLKNLEREGKIAYLETEKDFDSKGENWVYIYKVYEL